MGGKFKKDLDTNIMLGPDGFKWLEMVLELTLIIIWDLGLLILTNLFFFNYNCTNSALIYFRIFLQ